MTDHLTPRQLVKGILQGIAPPRPLFLPIVFSHATRVENVPLRTFLANPTKIFNSLRQVRAHLHSDGVTCYFDPFLEAEALGGVVQWDANGQPLSISWPQSAAEGEFPGESLSPDESTRSSRVAVAVEVIRRFKAMLRDDCLLTASVTGPLTLAALLAHLEPKHEFCYADIPSPALDLAAAVTSGIAKAFAEAGANVIFIREDSLPVLSPDDSADWAARLATATNIVRFYEGLPILLLTDKDAVAANRQLILRQSWDCVVCPFVDGMAPGNAGDFSELGGVRSGVALAPGIFDRGDAGGGDLDESIPRLISQARPAIVTTAGDVPFTADMERLNKVWEDVRR